MRNKVAAASQESVLTIQEPEFRIQKKFALERIPNHLLSRFDAFAKNPVHPSIPQGERIIKIVNV
jgi:hypothetical protein